MWAKIVKKVKQKKNLRISKGDFPLLRKGPLKGWKLIKGENCRGEKKRGLALSKGKFHFNRKRGLLSIDDRWGALIQRGGAR